MVDLAPFSSPNITLHFPVYSLHLLTMVSNCSISFGAPHRKAPAAATLRNEISLEADSAAVPKYPGNVAAKKENT